MLSSFGDHNDGGFQCLDPHLLDSPFRHFVRIVFDDRGLDDFWSGCYDSPLGNSMRIIVLRSGRMENR